MVERQDARCRDALVDMLYRQSQAGLLINLVMPPPIVFVLWGAVRQEVLLGWTALVYGLLLARLVLSRRYFRWAALPEPSRPGDARGWANGLTFLCWLSGLLWGAFGWFGFLPEQPHLLAFVCIVLAGMASGSVPSFSAYPPVYPGALVAMLVPFAWRCLVEAGEIYQVYAAFTACLACASLYYSRVTYRTLVETVRLRFENLGLIAGLERERDRAEAANLAKSRFLAAASHDLRQPVHALGLFASALAAMAQRGDVRAAEAGNIAAKLRAVLKNLGGLLHGLLDISRLDAGVVAAAPQPVPLSRFLADLRDEFAGPADAAGLSWTVVPSAAWVRSDPVLLKRILDNLVANALRYTEHGGVLLGCRRKGPMLQIQVVDTGIGIPAHQQDAVFDEFTQLDAPRRDRQQGLGLGLAIVRRLSRLLDHPVALRSVPGGGSVFSVQVPLCEPAEVAGAMDGARPEGAGIGIAVVDDDPSVLDAVGQLLEAWGHRVYAAPDVDGLCRMLEGARRHGTLWVDLILADYRLAGGVTGAAAIDRLRVFLGRPVPAAIVTGDTSPERLREASASGHRLLHKPLAAEDLQALVDDIAAKS